MVVHGEEVVNGGEMVHGGYWIGGACWTCGAWWIEVVHGCQNGAAGQRLLSVLIDASGHR